MNVWNDIKSMLGTIAIIYCVLHLIIYDNTDKDIWIRSGVDLIIDYKTGLNYLYRDGALIPRLDVNGTQIVSFDKN